MRRAASRSRRFVGTAHCQHASRNCFSYSTSSSVIATNSPSFSSNEPGQMRRRILFSAMHSMAEARSVVA